VGNVSPNRFKRGLRAGEVALGCSLNEARDPGTLRVLAAAGIDVVFVDLEHNPHSIETATDLVAHARAAGLHPLVRPPQLDRAWITRLLDGGCPSLLVPHLRGGDDVARLLELARYAPAGRRGVAMYGGATVGYQTVRDVPATMAALNDEVLVGIVIETPEAVDDLDAMLVEGVDLAVIGWTDLAAALGARDADDPIVVAIGDEVRRLCKLRGIAYGAFQSGREAVERELANGTQFVVSGGVFEYLRRGAGNVSAWFDECRGGVGRIGRPAAARSETETVPS